MFQLERVLYGTLVVLRLDHGVDVAAERHRRRVVNRPHNAILPRRLGERKPG